VQRIVPLSCTLSASLVTHGVAHKYDPSTSFLRFVPSLLPSLSHRLKMSGPPQVKAEKRKWQVHKKLKQAYDVVTVHLSKHTGVGFVCAVAYFDPYVFTLSFVLSCLVSDSVRKWELGGRLASRIGVRIYTALRRPLSGPIRCSTSGAASSIMVRTGISCGRYAL